MERTMIRAARVAPKPPDHTGLPRSFPLWLADAEAVGLIEDHQPEAKKPGYVIAPELVAVVFSDDCIRDLAHTSKLPAGTDVQRLAESVREAARIYISEARLPNDNQATATLPGPRRRSSVRLAHPTNVQNGRKCDVYRLPTPRSDPHGRPLRWPLEGFWGA
jgi:hypothetical protein